MRRLTWSDLHGQRCKKKIKNVPWAQVNNAFDRMTYLLLLIYHTGCEYLHDEEPIVQIEDFNSFFIDLVTVDVTGRVQPCCQINDSLYSF